MYTQEHSEQTVCILDRKFSMSVANVKIILDVFVCEREMHLILPTHGEYQREMCWI